MTVVQIHDVVADVADGLGVTDLEAEHLLEGVMYDVMLDDDGELPYDLDYEDTNASVIDEDKAFFEENFGESE